MRLESNNRGDTIVEVLIAMAVASFVIGGAYVVVNKTLGNSQRAQEHSEALKFAEAQVEQLKQTTDRELIYPAGVAPVIPPAPSPAPPSQEVFCFTQDRADGVAPKVVFTGASTVPAAESAYPDACKGVGIASLYRIAVQFDSHVAADSYDDVYTVYVRWPGPNGTDQEVSLVYKTVPPA
jgi:type II secretory pathway pseudopilin PulG